VRKLVLSETGDALDLDLSPYAAEVNKRFKPGSFQTQAEGAHPRRRYRWWLAHLCRCGERAGRVGAHARNRQAIHARQCDDAAHETREPFTREAAQAINAPTLLVLGGLSPPMFGQINEALASAIPNAQRVTIADATHTMNVIKPAAYNEAVVNFLRG
jgi:pimeloyl-ACP methyl ester carboxylesterase